MEEEEEAVDATALRCCFLDLIDSVELLFLLVDTTRRDKRLSTATLLGAATNTLYWKDRTAVCMSSTNVVVLPKREKRGNILRSDSSVWL